MQSPKLLAMLSIQPPIRGDFTLLELAKRRLGEAGIGGELYPGSLQHLQETLQFKPQDLPGIAHLPRGIDILQNQGRDQVVAYAKAAAGQLYGILLHDQRSFSNDLENTLAALDKLDLSLSKIANPPLVFIEYAAGLEPDFFAQLFEKNPARQQVSACIDISHVAIHVCRHIYAKQHPQQDVCALYPDSPDLIDKMGDIQTAMQQARLEVLELINRLESLGNPLHFHLHDGHPLSTLSEFGVSDHLSFLQKIRLPFAFEGRQCVDGVFGIDGLRQVVRTAMQTLPADKLSFTIEIHPQPGQTPLNEHSHLFQHWSNTENAERMNYWLDSLLHCASLLRDACKE